MLKKIIKLLLINAVALLVTERIIDGFRLGDGWQTLAYAALVLGVVNFFIKPIIGLLLLPINLLTLGSFKWVASAIALYLVATFVPEMRISSYLFQGYSYRGFEVPAVYLNSIWVYVIASLAINLVSGFLYWLSE